MVNNVTNRWLSVPGFEHNDRSIYSTDYGGYTLEVDDFYTDNELNFGEEQEFMMSVTTDVQFSFVSVDGSKVVDDINTIDGVKDALKGMGFSSVVVDARAVGQSIYVGTHETSGMTEPIIVDTVSIGYPLLKWTVRVDNITEGLLEEYARQVVPIMGWDVQDLANNAFDGERNYRLDAVEAEQE